MNGTLGNAKFNSLTFLLDYGSSHSKILGKHAQKFKRNISIRYVRAQADVTLILISLLK